MGKLGEDPLLPVLTEKPDLVAALAGLHRRLEARKKAATSPTGRTKASRKVKAKA
jgi:hypothetical protein